MNNDGGKQDPTQPIVAQCSVSDAWLAAHPFGEQDENGIDLSVLRRNLLLTPTARLVRLELAANEMLRLVANARTRS